MEVVIADVGDARLAPYRDLRTRGAARDERCIAESEHVVRRLLESPWPVESVVGTPARLERLRSLLPIETPVYALERATLDALVGFRVRRGVLACAPRPSWLERPLEWRALVQRPRARVLIAQGLADPANLGSILRSARAFGVDHVLVDRRGADPLERRAIRGAMGHCFLQPWSLAREALAEELGLAAAAGFQVIAATATIHGGRPAISVERFSAPEHAVLVVGNEGHGIEPQLLALADAAVTIPMARGVDSLGVAVATALLLHALTRPVRERG